MAYDDADYHNDEDGDESLDDPVILRGLLQCIFIAAFFSLRYILDVLLTVPVVQAMSHRLTTTVQMGFKRRILLSCCLPCGALCFWLVRLRISGSFCTDDAPGLHYKSCAHGLAGRLLRGLTFEEAAYLVAIMLVGYVHGRFERSEGAERKLATWTSPFPVSSHAMGSARRIVLAHLFDTFDAAFTFWCHATQPILGRGRRIAHVRTNAT